jgi:hypothetical protein
MGLVLSLFCSAPAEMHAQRVGVDAAATSDTSFAYSLRLRDGSTLIGRVIAATADSVTIRLRTAELTLPRSDIVEVRRFPRARLHDGEYWPENPAATRLLFAQTAFALDRGEAYYTNIWLIVHGAAVGITDRLMLGGGFTLIPGIGFGDNIFYLAPKLSVVATPQVHVALGAMLGWAPGFDNDGTVGSDNATGGILYGVSSFGDRDTNADVGLGWWYGNGDVSSRPVIMVGGEWRGWRRLALLSENWFVTQHRTVTGALGYGVRFLGERLSADLAFVNATGSSTLPGVPWLSVAVKF